MYVFGDSLSDTGNLAAILDDATRNQYFNPAGPYNGFRLTNGKVAVEYIAEGLGGVPLAPSYHLPIMQGSPFY